MPKRLFDSETERCVCEYYWTQQANGYYPSASETGAHFQCTNVHVLTLLRKHGYPVRTNAETRAGRPCRPIKNLPAPGEEPPPCKCGCGQPVSWNQRMNGWEKYVGDHWKPLSRPYKNEAWLRRRYVDECATKQEIAAECGVAITSITIYMRKFGIAPRTHSQTLVARGSVSGPSNPAWKGGVAKWAYSSDWKRLCRQIKDRDQWTCQMCGEQRKRWNHSLHVHHIDENKLNNHPHNLIALCAACHAPLHGTKARAAAKHLRAVAKRNTAQAHVAAAFD